MPSVKTASGQNMRTRASQDSAIEKAIRRQMIKPKPNWDHDLGKLVQGSDPHTYMKRTYEMRHDFDTVTEGIFKKIFGRKNKLQQLRKRLSDDLPAKMKRQKFQSFLKQYGALEAKKRAEEGTLREDVIGWIIEQSFGGAPGSLGGGFGTKGTSSTRFGGGSGGKSMGTISNVGGKVTGSGTAGGGFGTKGSGTQRFSGSNVNSGQMSGSTYNQGSATYGNNTRRLGSPSRASRPTPTPAKTSGGRMGGGDSRNVGRASPGSRRPGQANNPAARANPTARGGSPTGGRGSVYGGNRQYSGRGQSRHGNRGTRPSVGDNNPQNQQTSWWKR